MIQDLNCEKASKNANSEKKGYIAVKPAASATIPKMEERKPTANYASFWRRLGAQLIDSIIGGCSHVGFISYYHRIYG